MEYFFSRVSQEMTIKMTNVNKILWVGDLESHLGIYLAEHLRLVKNNTQSLFDQFLTDPGEIKVVTTLIVQFQMFKLLWLCHGSVGRFGPGIGSHCCMPVFPDGGYSHPFSDSHLVLSCLGFFCTTGHLPEEGCWCRGTWHQMKQEWLSMGFWSWPLSPKSPMCPGWRTCVLGPVFSRSNPQIYPPSRTLIHNPRLSALKAGRPHAKQVSSCVLWVHRIIWAWVPSSLGPGVLLEWCPLCGTCHPEF